ncbi:accessory Sec system protein translocase subunit SecY2 [Streptococcus merionis]
MLTRKWLFTVLIVFVFIFGRQLPIFTVGLDSKIRQGASSLSFMQNLASVSGMQLSKLSVFSLGLSPWMSSVIIWRLLTLFKLLRLDRLTGVKSAFYQNILMVIIALIQSYAMTDDIEFISHGSGLSQGVLRLVTILLLVTGTAVLTWLGSMNSEFGIGGYIIVMLVNMILSMVNLMLGFITMLAPNALHIMLAIVIFMLVSMGIIWLTVLMYRGQYRIPLRSVSIHNDFLEETYLPISINPAGGMPAMYGMTLLTLPVMIFQALSSAFPDNEIWQYLATNVTTTSLLGAILYIVLLWVLTIGFAYINIDPEEVAFSLRKSGTYIDGVYPGLETERYLRKIVSFFAKLGGVFICLVCGVPFLIGVLFPSYYAISSLFSYIFIISSLMFTVIEQVATLKIAKQYKGVLD